MRPSGGKKPRVDFDRELGNLLKVVGFLVQAKATEATEKTKVTEKTKANIAKWKKEVSDAVTKVEAAAKPGTLTTEEEAIVRRVKDLLGEEGPNNTLREEAKEKKIGEAKRVIEGRIAAVKAGAAVEEVRPEDPVTGPPSPLVLSPSPSPSPSPSLDPGLLESSDIPTSIPIATAAAALAHVLEASPREEAAIVIANRSTLQRIYDLFAAIDIGTFIYGLIKGVRHSGTTAPAFGEHLHNTASNIAEYCGSPRVTIDSRVDRAIQQSSTHEESVRHEGHGIG